MGTSGLLLWLNLPRCLKEAQPEYQIYKPNQLGRRSFPGGRAIVVAGEGSPVYTTTPLDLVDISMTSGEHYRGRLPEGYSTFIYVLDGMLGVEGWGVEPHQAAVMRPGMDLDARAGEDTSFVIVSGKRIGEPIRLLDGRVE